MRENVIRLNSASPGCVVGNALRHGHARRARIHFVGRLRPAHLNFVRRVRESWPSASRDAPPSTTAGTETRASRWPTPAYSAPARRRSEITSCPLATRRTPITSGTATRGAGRKCSGPSDAPHFGQITGGKKDVAAAWQSRRLAGGPALSFRSRSVTSIASSFEVTSAGLEISPRIRAASDLVADFAAPPRTPGTHTRPRPAAPNAPRSPARRANRTAAHRRRSARSRRSSRRSTDKTPRPSAIAARDYSARPARDTCEAALRRGDVRDRLAPTADKSASPARPG